MTASNHGEPAPPDEPAIEGTAERETEGATPRARWGGNYIGRYAESQPDQLALAQGERSLRWRDFAFIRTAEAN